MDAYLALVSIVAVILAGVAFLFYQKNRTYNQLMRDHKAHPSDWASHGLTQTMAEVDKKAEQIITQAEMDSLRMLTDKKTESALFEKQYQEKLDLLANQLTSAINADMQLVSQRLNEELGQVQNKFNQHIATIEGQLATSQKNIEESMRTKVNELLFNFEENLSSFLSNSEQKSFEAVNLELKAAKQLIESYKSQQLSLVDENIVSVLERTLDLVLKEKLSLRNQIDLVYESLEKAKLESFFV